MFSRVLLSALATTALTATAGAASAQSTPTIKPGEMILSVPTAGEVHPQTEGENTAGMVSGRFLLVYARRDRRGAIDPDAAMIIDFLPSSAGQASIARHTLGYRPLNPHEVAEEHRELQFYHDLSK